jgi:hypothetical protein
MKLEDVIVKYKNGDIAYIKSGTNIRDINMEDVVEFSVVTDGDTAVPADIKVISID